MRFWFVETENFTKDWIGLRLTAADFFRMQDTIMLDPTLHPVIPGTGGLRKLRFAPASSARGKRGALRICFAYLRDYALIVLVWVYSKKAKDDLSADEKKSIKRWLGQLEQEIERRFSKPECV